MFFAATLTVSTQLQNFTVEPNPPPPPMVIVKMLREIIGAGPHLLVDDMQVVRVVRAEERWEMIGSDQRHTERGYRTGVINLVLPPLSGECHAIESIPPKCAMPTHGGSCLCRFYDRVQDCGSPGRNGLYRRQPAFLAAGRRALDALYNATNGASWTNRLNWLDPLELVDICNRYGVTCLTAQNTEHVSGIDLAGNNLIGMLPPNLFNGPSSSLPFLQTFNVPSNGLSGSLPSLTGLMNLHVFSAYSNQLTGSIPALTGLTSLQHFDVNTNLLAGTIPSLAGLTLLSYIHVDHNQLTGTIPSLAGLAALNTFDVSYNQLTGAAPAPPSPNNLINGVSALCPNRLDVTDTSYDVSWDAAAGWVAPQHWSYYCDHIHIDGFEPIVVN